MKKSRLINIFKTLTKKEIRDLRKWLLSPAHNQREDTVLLFEYLVAEDNLQQESLLDKSTVFKHLMPDEQEFDDAKMRQVMYFLLKSTESFLIYDEFSKDEIGSDILLTRVFRRKKLDKLLQKNIKDTSKKNNTQIYRNKDFYEKDYEIKNENYEYLSSISRTLDFKLQEVNDSLDTYYICMKLRQCCITASHQRVFKKEYNLGLAESIVEYVKEKKLTLIPAIGIYYYGYFSIVEKEESSHFENLKAILFSNEAIFPKTELGQIYLLAINYCIQKMNSGEKPFIREAFELYKRGFEKQYLILENRITVYTFINVVLIALRIKEYKWAEKFIENYQNFIPKDNREGTSLYCKARLEHDLGNYEEAMSLFVKVEHNDILLTLNAKTFLLKMYFEQDELKVLDSLLESMRTYLSRKKVVGYHKENYQNIIKYTKKLVRVNPFNKKDKEKLKNEIEKVTPLTERSWILDQLTKV